MFILGVLKNSRTDVFEIPIHSSSQATHKIKQAENQQASFIKLIEELTELKNKNKVLEDLSTRQEKEIQSLKQERTDLQSVVDDYSMLLGDAHKKQK